MPASAGRLSSPCSPFEHENHELNFAVQFMNEVCIIHVQILNEVAASCPIMGLTVPKASLLTS